jgi:beta-lactamase superfamily II metal-dependent hydrolase
MRQTAPRHWGLAALLVLTLHAGSAWAFTPSGFLEIHYVNVQQGGSTLIIGPDGTTVLMDAGNPGKGIGEVVPYLTSLGLMPADGLDHTLAGHLDTDHVGGFSEVLAAGYDVREANWFNGSTKTGGAVDAWRAAASLTTAGLPRAIPLGHTIPLGGGALLTVVAVAGNVLGGAGVPQAASNENDLSVAVLVEYGAFDFLWASDLGGGDADQPCTGRSTGQADVETPLARALTPGGAAVRLSQEGVDVLHVNHHGSESSTNSEWMNRLRPEVAVISVGAGQGGSFHHPRRDVVEGVLRKGAPCVTVPAALVLQTEEGSPSGAGTSFAGFAVGDVRITSDGPTYRIEASGEVSQGPDERAAAGLPRTFSSDEADDAALAFLGGRFRASVEWRTRTGLTGRGHAVPFTDRAGLFWFFAEENLEMLIKMLDGCSLNDRFWVFFAATTNVEFTVTVVDTETGERREYSNTLDHAADPVLDTAAFATCDGAGPGPQASFTWSCRGYRCQFTDTSDPPPGGFILGHRWDFGDGTDTIVSDPLHGYLRAGTFTVRLEVEDLEGATDAVEEVVNVACISRFACCKVCTASRACGDSCISSGFSCSKGIGCACDDEEVC